MKVGRVPTDAMSSGVEALCSPYTCLRQKAGSSDPLGGSSPGETVSHTIQAYLETPSPEVEQTDSGEQVSDMVTYRSPIQTDVKKDDCIPLDMDTYSSFQSQYSGSTPIQDYDGTLYEVDSVTGMPTNNPSELKITAVRRS